MTAEIVPYDADRHFAGLARIWRECGWLEDDRVEPLRLFTEANTVWITELDGSAEAVAMTGSGTLRYQTEDLRLGIVTSVNTSLVARRQGLAGRVTAHAIQAEVGKGAEVIALGVFDRGFYDKLGFGSGPQELFYRFDPADLEVPRLARAPVRLGRDDFEEVHAARLARRRRHGAVNLDHPGQTLADFILEPDSGFGLGFRDPQTGRLTHLMVVSAKDQERGPFRVRFAAYHTADQLLELLSLLQGMADQITRVMMPAQPGIPLEDLLRTPFRTRMLTQGTKDEASIRGWAWWQMRIADLPAVMAKTHLLGPPVAFNLVLSDPIADRLSSGDWRGVAGDWRVVLGPQSSAERGQDPSWPTLRASVNAFTRLWLGSAPATGLALTDDLAGSTKLLEALDSQLCLPTPSVDWGF